MGERKELLGEQGKKSLLLQTDLFIKNLNFHSIWEQGKNLVFNEDLLGNENFFSLYFCDDFMVF